MTKCDWCSKEVEDTVPYTYIFEEEEFEICDECMNLAGNREWRKLAKRCRELNPDFRKAEEEEEDG